MKLDLLSFDGNTFSPNYQVSILYPRQLRPQATPNLLDVAGVAPAYTGKTFGGGYLSILVKYLDTLPEDVHIREAEISRWFDTMNDEPLKLLAQDIADSDRQWYVMATPLSITQDGDTAIIQLLLDDPYWSVETASTSTWTITGTGQTKTITNLGNVARPIIKITPTSARAGGYSYMRFVEVSGYYDMPNYPINIGPLDTAALVTAGKCQADGDDFRVFIDGVEVPRWFGTGTSAFNQTTTKIWIVLDVKQRVYLDGRYITAVGAGAITELEYQKSAYVRERLGKLPAKGIVRYLKAVDVREYFTYTGVDLVNCKLTGVTREAKNSTTSTFPALLSTSFGFIEHDIWLVYGNASATAPVYDESHKPIFDLTNSTNNSWVYTEFYEEGKPRAGGWTKNLFTSSLGSSAPYTGDRGATANPATEAGLRMATTKKDGAEAAENATQAWTISIPGGIHVITTMTGEKYRAGSDWPTTEVQKSDTSAVYETASSIATPSASATWEAVNIAAVTVNTNADPSVSNVHFLRLIQTGTLSALASNSASVEIEGCTLAMVNTGIASIRSEATSTYYLEAIITNDTTGDAITIVWPMKLNEMLIVDCDARTVTYQDGTNALAAVTLNSDRVDWLNIEYGSTQLSYTETGAAGLTVVLEWKDKAII